MEDRRFRIPIEIDSWEDAAPILLGENLDHHLGLETTEEQEDFLRLTGFSSVPAAANQGPSRVPAHHLREHQDQVHLSLVVSESSFPPLPSSLPLPSSGEKLVPEVLRDSSRLPGSSSSSFAMAEECLATPICIGETSIRDKLAGSHEDRGQSPTKAVESENFQI